MARSRNRRTRKTREKTNEAHQAQIAQFEERWRRDLEQRGPSPDDPNAPTIQRIAAEIQNGGRPPTVYFERVGASIRSWAWRFEPDLDYFQRRGLLDAGRTDAAWRFCEIAHAYAKHGDPKIANLAIEIIQGGDAPLTQQERRLLAKDKFWGAWCSVSERRRVWLLWLLGVTEERAIHDMVSRWYPKHAHKPERERRNKGHDYLAEACEELAIFFHVPVLNPTIIPEMSRRSDDALASQQKKSQLLKKTA